MGMAVKKPINRRTSRRNALRGQSRKAAQNGQTKGNKRSAFQNFNFCFCKPDRNRDIKHNKLRSKLSLNY